MLASPRALPRTHRHVMCEHPPSLRIGALHCGQRLQCDSVKLTLSLCSSSRAEGTQKPSPHVSHGTTVVQ